MDCDLVFIIVYSTDLILIHAGVIIGIVHLYGDFRLWLKALPKLPHLRSLEVKIINSLCTKYTCDFIGKQTIIKEESTTKVIPYEKHSDRYPTKAEPNTTEYRMGKKLLSPMQDSKLQL